MVLSGSRNGLFVVSEAAGQAAVGYTYDLAGRLTQIGQGTATVGFSYDNASRRSTLTQPNGVTVAYSFDAASQLTGLTYSLGQTTLGNLTYAYDTAGRRTSVGGSFARTGLPLAQSSATYNANNQLTQWATAALTYDLNGNLTGDGVNNYHWDVRNQLSSISAVNGGATIASFQYDAFGRRSGILPGTCSVIVTRSSCRRWAQRPLFRSSCLRHADIQTTLNIYMQAISAETREAASKVVDVLWRM